MPHLVVAAFALAANAQGSIFGLNVATLGLVGQKDLTGVNIGGLGTVAQGSVSGISVGGLGLVAQGGITGLSVAGLGLLLNVCPDFIYLNLFAVKTARASIHYLLCPFSSFNERTHNSITVNTCHAFNGPNGETFNEGGENRYFFLRRKGICI